MAMMEGHFWAGNAKIFRYIWQPVGEIVVVFGRFGIKSVAMIEQNCKPDVELKLG